MSRLAGSLRIGVRRTGLLAVGLSMLWGSGTASASDEPVVVLGVWKDGHSDTPLWHRLAVWLVVEQDLPVLAKAVHRMNTRLAPSD